MESSLLVNIDEFVGTEERLAQVGVRAKSARFGVRGRVALCLSLHEGHEQILLTRRRFTREREPERVLDATRIRRRRRQTLPQDARREMLGLRGDEFAIHESKGL